MRFAVVRGSSYCLVHAPGLVEHGGTTAATERARQPDSPYLQRLPAHLRDFDAAVAYPPNQAFIGNLRPEALATIPRPWHEIRGTGGRFGAFGEIMPEDEFYGLVKVADVFGVVHLEADFASRVADRLAGHPLLAAVATRIGAGQPAGEVARLAAVPGSIPLQLGERLCGVVQRAHDTDDTLSAHVMLENLCAKASAWLAVAHLLAQVGMTADQVDYVLECSEEACGDMNQRGGGNFAKAIAEIAGCAQATGTDTRAFCAAPAYSMITAAGLVQAGIYRNVLVVAGGSVPKLGMNSRDHVAKGLPALEDVLGAFAVLVAPDDGVNPVIRTDRIGRHPVGAGSTPQAVMEHLAVQPLAAAGLRLADVDRFASELHNPELTEPAGAGDVPRSNYRLIAALAVKQGELDRAELNAFVDRHGVPGYAPTQGHVPSGIPYVGPARQALLAGEMQRVMIIGKGSLFLARMTNLFDGVSFMMEPNPAAVPAATVVPGEVVASAGEGAAATEGAEPGADRRHGPRLRLALNAIGFELGLAEAVQGAEMAQAAHPDLEIILVAPPGTPSRLSVVSAADEDAAKVAVQQLLTGGEAAAAVTAHYAFPLGVATVGRLRAPGTGRSVLLATTTGASAADAVQELVRNAVAGLAVARSLGWPQPTVGLLNVRGAPAALRALSALGERGYALHWAPTVRADGGALLRGNDLLAGAADVLVADALTGNLLVKVLNAAGSGGKVEVAGEGYGPGVGEGMEHLVCIVSRASAASVIAGALGFASELARGNLPAAAAREYAAARQAGLGQGQGQGAGAAVAGATAASGAQADTPVAWVPAGDQPLTFEIPGIDVLRLEEAVDHLGRKGIPARAGAGCTGPVALVARSHGETAQALLRAGGYFDV